MIDAWAVNVSATAFWAEPFNLPFLIAFGAAALLFAGAGSLLLDARSSEIGALASASLWHCWSWRSPRHC